MCGKKIFDIKRKKHVFFIFFTHCRIRTCISTQCMGSTVWAKWVFVKSACVCLCVSIHAPLLCIFSYLIFFSFFTFLLQSFVVCVDVAFVRVNVATTHPFIFSFLFLISNVKWKHKGCHILCAPFFFHSQLKVCVCWSFCVCVAISHTQTPFFLKFYLFFLLFKFQ